MAGCPSPVLGDSPESSGAQCQEQSGWLESARLLGAFCGVMVCDGGRWARCGVVVGLGWVEQCMARCRLGRRECHAENGGWRQTLQLGPDSCYLGHGARAQGTPNTAIHVMDGMRSQQNQKVLQLGQRVEAPGHQRACLQRPAARCTCHQAATVINAELNLSTTWQCARSRLQVLT